MPDWKAMRTHRTWEDWLAIVLALGIVFAPWVVRETYNSQAVANATLAGFAILLLAELDLVRFRRWAEVGQLVCGLWVTASSYIFGYAAGGELRYWHLVAGLGVAALAALELWQRREPQDQ